MTSAVEGRPIVALTDGVKRYGGTLALDHVSVTVRPGEVVGLIGQNGAGKSSLLKVLCGIEQLTSGTLDVRGETDSLAGIIDAADHGVGMVFQEQSLIPNLTVAENIILGRRHAATKQGLIRWKSLEQYAHQQLSKIEAHGINPSATVSTLSFAERQSVELAKVVSLENRYPGPPLALLDEPTSILDAPQIALLFKQIRRLAERAGVVFVSHRLDEVLEISDRVYIMRDGQVVAEREVSDCDTDDLYELMVGQVASSDFYLRSDFASPTMRPDAPRIRLDALSGDGFDDVSLELHPGEILGIAGVIGSGRDHLCRAIFGANPITSGSITLDGREFRPRTPAASSRSGIGFVPAERKVEGMISGGTVRTNIVLGRSASGTALLMDRSTEDALVSKWIDQLDIKTPHPDVNINNLSGGNQQKAVLAKWLAKDLKVLILDHPTRGLDVGAKQEVYRVVRDAARQGVSIIVLADTLDEILGLSDQVLTMRDGRVTGFFPDCMVTPPSPAQLVELMV